MPLLSTVKRIESPAAKRGATRSGPPWLMPYSARNMGDGRKEGIGRPRGHAKYSGFHVPRRRGQERPVRAERESHHRSSVRKKWRGVFLLRSVPNPGSLGAAPGEVTAVAAERQDRHVAFGGQFVL